MKKFFLSALLAVSIVGVRAQNIAAGTVSLGGNVGFSSNTDKSEYKANNSTYANEYTHSQFQFAPSVGYFLADNLAIGLSLGYTAAKDKVTYSGPGTTSPSSLDARTTLRVGPYVQYYKMLSEQFGIVGTFGAGYENSFTPNYANNNPNPSRVIETKASGFYAAITPGIVFFPSPN